MKGWEIPTVALSLAIFLATPPTTLGDAARLHSARRWLVSPSTRTFNNLELARLLPARSAPVATEAPPVQPPPGVEPPATVVVAPPEPAPRTAARDEAWWRERMLVARSTLERDELLVEALQSRANALTNDVAARDDPYQRAQLVKDLERVNAELGRMRERVTKARKAIVDILEEARRAGVPPGWLR